jgi:hypothetical protein
MYLIINDRTSPQFNLAFEEYALTETDFEAVVLWRNSKAVIIGCSQNAVEEIDLEYTRKYDIPVIRRLFYEAHARHRAIRDDAGGYRGHGGARAGEILLMGLEFWKIPLLQHGALQAL